jgi:release factor glutamine methyltransferase
VTRAPREQAKSLLAEASVTLTEAGIDSAALDAELLLAAAAGVDRTRLLTGSLPLCRECVSRFEQLIARRAAREPIAYILGHKEFYGLDFAVNRSVLIPRPETELLVDTALKMLRERPPSRVLDLGTGSGAIAVAIAANASEAEVTATDISAPALELARRNARRHGCELRIKFYTGDLFAALPCSHQKYDLILSTPPYVRVDEIARLEPEVARHEPQIALLGGKDGLDFYRRLAAEIASHLRPEGEVMVEVGAGQAAEVARLLEAGGCRALETLRDLAGHKRVVRARRAD